MSAIDDLRILARRRRSAVTSKERRIFNNTGVDLKNTKDDPRRAPSIVKKYNTRQLTDYIKQLDKFMLRENGYIADSSGGLIPKRDWLKYKRTEKTYNKMVKAKFDKIADIHDPHRNMTIRQAEGLFVPENLRAAGEIRHRPYNEIHRNAKNIKNVEALKKLQAQVDGKRSKAYLVKALDAGRKQAGQMLDNAGISELKSALAGLSNQQFNVLWNYWGFAGRLAQIGESGGEGKKNIDRHDPFNAEQKDDIRDDIKEFIEDAKKLTVD
jgi:hypothetical protein